MHNRKCLKCFKLLLGRADQKFCNDQCRSAYNNPQYFKTNSVIKSVNRILKKNHSILTTLKAKGKTTVNKSDLQKNGYCFDHFTFTITTRNSEVNFFCYDHGYRVKENDTVIIVQRNLDDEMIVLMA